jgi:hypothetical protein
MFSIEHVNWGRIKAWSNPHTRNSLSALRARSRKGFRVFWSIVNAKFIGAYWMCWEQKFVGWGVQIDRILCNTLPYLPPPTSPAIRSSEFKSVVTQAHFDISSELETNLYCCTVPFEDSPTKKCTNSILYISLKLFTVTLIPLTWRIRWPPNNASRWQRDLTCRLKG